MQLAAPGVNIISTLFSSYGFMSGTSMAAPFVTGTVALVESAHPTWTTTQVVDAILDHTTAAPSLAGKVTTGGILNAGLAVANTNGAYITAAAANGIATPASPLTSIQVTFNEDINQATFTPQQVSLTGPAGPISGISVAAVSGPNGHAFLISFTPQTTVGTYGLTVSAAILDLYGNKLDQNRNGTNGQTTDVFTKAFTLITSSTVAQNSVNNSQPANTGPPGHNTFTAGNLQAGISPSATVSSAPVEMGTLDFTTAAPTAASSSKRPFARDWSAGRKPLSALAPRKHIPPRAEPVFPLDLNPPKRRALACPPAAQIKNAPRTARIARRPSPGR